MTDSILTKWLKILAILGFSFVLQIIIYFRFWRGARPFSEMLILVGFWFIIPVIGILLLIIIIGSGIIIKRWIKDSGKGKKLYLILVLLLVIVLWLSTPKIFSFIDYLTQYQYPNINSL